MKLKQRFFMLAGLVGVLMAVVSVMGFFTAYNNLEESVESEMRSTIEGRADGLESWLIQKSEAPSHLAVMQESLGESVSLADSPQFMGIVNADKEILDVYTGRESDGKIVCYYAGDISDKMDPRTRGWYKDAKAAGKLIYSEVYTDANSGKQCISLATPFKINGQFAGVIGADIAADVLEKHAEEIQYHGEGHGYIIDKNGTILATDGPGEVMGNISTAPGIGDHFESMKGEGEGYFVFNSPEGKKVFAYHSIPATEWIIGISVDEDFVFGSLSGLKWTYGILTLLGIAISVFMCLKLSATVTGPVVELKERADELAQGHLNLQDLAVNSKDEIGEMTASFNAMTKNLRNLIGKMASTSEQVAAASEELTANAQQSADSAIHVAETVGEVSGSMESQLNDIDNAKREVDAVFTDIGAMNEKAQAVSRSSNDTANAAKKGAALMNDAISRMGGIEKSVMDSAAMVRQLADNSQEIGTIVEAISAISDQTNLLALNAAIEAARAGEQGRGFAVVAEEVRKLAAESAASAEQIREKLVSILADTKRTVDAMEKGTNEVASGTQAIRDVGTQFNDILNKVNDIQKQIGLITTSVATVSSGASNIVNAVDAIDTISRRTAGNTNTISQETEQQSASNEEIAAASQSLAKLAEDMQIAINNFKL